MKIKKNDLYDYENRHIFQCEDGFKFSLDSILLAEYTILKQNDKVVDLCTGNAPVPLILSSKYSNKILCFEIQKEVFELGKKSIEYNKLDQQIKIVNDDVKNINKYIDGKVDVITCNPPYFKLNSAPLSNNEIERNARHETLISLEDIFEICGSNLENGGAFYLVHRANRVDEIISLASKNKMNVKEITFIKTDNSNEYKIMLVKCLKNSKNGVKIMHVDVQNVKTYKNIFKEVI